MKKMTDDARSMAGKTGLISRIRQCIDDACRSGDAEKEGDIWEVLLDNTGRIPLPAFSKAVLPLCDMEALKAILNDVTGLPDEDVDDVQDVPNEGLAEHVA